jgi:hypothetical protein
MLAYLPIFTKSSMNFYVLPLNIFLHIVYLQGSGDFWAQPAKIRPFKTSTGFPMIWPVANLLPFIWTGQYPVFFFQVPANFFFIVMTTGQELGHWWVSRFSNVVKLWNAIMQQKLRMFAIHQTATSLQRTYNLNPRTTWCPALDESNRMKFAYFTIHSGKNHPHQNDCRLKSDFFYFFIFFIKHRFHILHSLISTRLFTKPIGRHYTKYRFSPDIVYLPILLPVDDITIFTMLVTIISYPITFS